MQNQIIVCLSLQARTQTNLLAKCEYETGFNLITETQNEIHLKVCASKWRSLVGFLTNYMAFASQPWTMNKRIVVIVELAANETFFEYENHH